MTLVVIKNGYIFHQTPSAIADLKKARDLIADERNWCQGTMRRGSRICAWEAILEACGRDLQRAQRAASHLESYIHTALHGIGFRPIITFNDIRDRKHSEVLALFDAAGATA